MSGLTQYLGQFLKAFRLLMGTNQRAKQKKTIIVIIVLL